jgi:AraC-like DNA-binding protein
MAQLASLPRDATGSASRSDLTPRNLCECGAVGIHRVWRQVTGRSGCDIDAYMLDRTEVGQSVDILAEILDTVHVQAARAEVLRIDREMMGQAIQAGGVVVFVVRAGHLVGDFGGEPVEIGPGDVVAVLRPGQRFSLGLPATPRDSGIRLLDSAAATNSVGPSVADASVLRCACVFADPERNPLLGALPPIIHVLPRQWIDAQWLEPTVAWIEREVLTTSPGAQVVANRLIELLWVQLVRTHIATTPVASHGWLRALSDPQISGALSLIHGQPAAPFTVAGLAQTVGMSRSAFASQFARLVGEPPLHYVARWRMLKAAQLLKEDKQALAEVATAVGYESEAAFSKAFRRWSGQAPGSFRRDRRSVPADVAQLLTG